MSKQAKSLIVAVLLIVGIGFGAYIFWGNKQSTAPEEKLLQTPDFEEQHLLDENALEEETSAEGGSASGGEEESIGGLITVVANEYNFSPNQINISSEEEIVIEFVNLGVVPHNFVVDMGDGSFVQTPIIALGETANVTVSQIPPGATKLVFYCSVGDHRQRGMEGEFIIE